VGKNTKIFEGGMKMKKLLLFAMLAGLLIAPNVFADTIVGTAGYGWQTWVSGNLNENGAPYWDKVSADGSHKNVGYYLTNTGFFTGSTDGPGAIPFWGSAYNSGGDTGGAADPSFYFTGPAAYSTASFKLEIAGNAAHNEFGWYLSTGSAPDLGDLNPIFYGSDTPASPDVAFSPTGDYGFYIKVNGAFYTTEGFSVGDGADGFQHFAVFQDGSSYWVGMEDFHGGADFDYNDMIVKLTPVPEPVSMLLLGSGLIGLAGYARRRFKK
jgi:hypothetical protein